MNLDECDAVAYSSGKFEEMGSWLLIMYVSLLFYFLL